MRLIKPKVEIINQEPGVEGLFKHMELCARTCYKSEDKITEDSARKFIDNVIVARGHTAMLEHGTVYLIIDCSGRLLDVANKYVNNKYSEWTLHPDGVHYCITTNYRVLLQNGWLDDLQYLCEPTEYHVRRITVRFICDMGVAREFCRHRVFSFAQESTRYCNYSKEKFQGVTYILPQWCTNVNIRDYENNPKLMYNVNGILTDIEINFLCGLYDNEIRYLKLLEDGWVPQQARVVLPNALKTELVMTGFISDWEHFFKLRDAGSAHPQARELAQPLHKEFIKRNYVE